MDVLSIIMELIFPANMIQHIDILWSYHWIDFPNNTGYQEPLLLREISLTSVGNEYAITSSEKKYM